MAESVLYEHFTLEHEMSFLKYFEEDVNLERNADIIRSTSVPSSDRENQQTLGLHIRCSIQEHCWQRPIY
jgi:hypothetical protein